MVSEEEERAAREENERRDEQDLYDKWNPRVREALLFGVGFFGCIYVIFLVPDPPPSILVFLGSLIGMPFILSADEHRKRNRDKGSS